MNIHIIWNTFYYSLLFQDVTIKRGNVEIDISMGKELNITVT